ncbi:hypothetical protein CEXT_717141 [Caerostris extrusa]|uniref:Uncharacterized protein n=1 Tax=Caerostris extrusa TaxID=172846 RepID=A0AAV4NZW2_CAEEX|nr:hypothetical protein CEXT_717141 [Caerostris extrusa]
MAVSIRSAGMRAGRNLQDKKVQSKVGKNVTPSDDKVRIGGARPGDERVIYVGDVWGGVLKGTKLSHRSPRQDLRSTSPWRPPPANAFAVIIEFANTFT